MGPVIKFDSYRGGSKSLKVLKIFIPHLKCAKRFDSPTIICEICSYPHTYHILFLCKSIGWGGNLVGLWYGDVPLFRGSLFLKCAEL